MSEPSMLDRTFSTIMKRMVETGMTPEFQVGKDLIERAGAGAMSVATRFNNPAMALSFIKQI